MGEIPCFFLLLRGAYPSLAVPAPNSHQQASCYFGVRIPSGRSRPRTASSKLPVTSGCVPLPGGHGPAQRPASFLLLRGAYPFRAVTAPYSVQQASCYFGVRPPSGWSRPRTASSKPPVTSGPHGLPGRPGPVQRPASFLLLRGASPSREVLTPHSVQQASCYFGVRTPSGRSRPRTASSKLPVTSGPHGLPGRPGPEPRPACPGVCLIADTKSLLLFWLFSVHDSNCRIS